MKSVVLVVAWLLAFCETLPVSEVEEIQEQRLRGDIIIEKKGPINIVVSVEDEINDEIIDPKKTDESFPYNLYPKTHSQEITPEELLASLKEYRKEVSDAATMANGRSTIHDEIIDIELDSEGFPHDLALKKHGKDTLNQMLFVPLNEAIKDLRDLAMRRVENGEVDDKVFDVELDGDEFLYKPYPKVSDGGNIPQEFSVRKEDSTEEVQGVTIAKLSGNNKFYHDINDKDFPFLPLQEKQGEEIRPEDASVPKEDSSEEALSAATKPKEKGNEQEEVSGEKSVSRNPGDISYTDIDTLLTGFADLVIRKTEEGVLPVTLEGSKEEYFSIKETRNSARAGQPNIVISPRNYIIPVTIPGRMNYSERRLLPLMYPPPEMTTMDLQGNSVVIPNRTRFSKIFKPAIDPEEDEVKYKEEIFAEDFQPLEEEPEENEEDYDLVIDLGDYDSVEVDPMEESKEYFDLLTSTSKKEPFTVMKVNDDIIFPMENYPEKNVEVAKGELDSQKQILDFLDYAYTSRESNEDSYDVMEDDPDSHLTITLSQEPEDSQDRTFDYSSLENLLDKFLSGQIRKELERSYPFKAARSRILPLPLRRDPRYPLAW